MDTERDPKRPSRMCPIDSPCKDCQDRFLGCHSKCEKYIAFRKKRDEQLDEINKQKKFEANLTNYIIDSIDRNRRNGLHRSHVGMDRRHRK